MADKKTSDTVAQSPTAPPPNSKEKLRLLNAELVRLNAQLSEKVHDLETTNHDLANLLIATETATLFLDSTLELKRFTEPMAKFFPLSEADIGRPLRELSAKFSDTSLLNDCETVLRMSAPIENQIRTADGHYYLRRIVPYGAGDSGIDGVVVNFLDVTERVDAETNVRQLGTILRSSNDAIIITTLDGDIAFWNHGAEKAYGYSETEALKLNLADIVPEPHRRTFHEIETRIRNGEDNLAYESQRCTRDGRVLDVEVTLTVFKNAKGDATHLARTERDITARLQREHEIRHLNAELERRISARTSELKASDFRMRAVLDASGDAILTVDADGTIQSFNKSAERMFGYSADEAIGEPFATLTRNQYSVDAKLGAAKGDSPPVLGAIRELRARRKNGSEFPAQITVAPVDHLGLHIAVIRDVTEPRALQEEIARVATAEQRRIGEELHDSTQQELTGLGLLAQHLADDELTLEDMRKLAAKLARGISKTNRHVKQLAKGLVPVAVDADGLMVALSELAERTAEEAGIDCEFFCPTKVRIPDDATALQLYRIAQEAVTNAVKHASPRKIKIGLEYSSGNIEMKVTDDGIGIRQESWSNGGLGLRLMRHRCDLIGGSLDVDRRQPDGTQVCCQIPVDN